MTPDPRTLSGTCAVVTGGASGIGRALCELLAAHGTRVVIADVEDDAGRAVAQQLVERHRDASRALFVHTDVADPGSVEALADAAYDHAGRVDLLVNNAGVVAIGELLELSRRDWERVLAVNLWGVVNGVLTFFPRFARQDGWRYILNVGSMAGLRPPPHVAPYTTSKFAVIGLSEALRIEARPYGIGVSVVCPGPVATGIRRHHRPAPTAEAGTPRESLLRHFDRDDDRRSAEDVARQAVAGVLAGRFYIATHPELRDDVQRRFDEVLAAFAVPVDASARPPEA